MTSIERAIADLDAHLATLPPEARAAAEEIARALAPLVTRRKAELDALLSDETGSRLMGVVKAGMMTLAIGGRDNLGDSILGAIEKHGPTLSAALAHAARE